MVEKIVVFIGLILIVMLIYGTFMFAIHHGDF